FVGRERTVVRKIKEALTAIKLERNYSKEEILQMYLNQYYFGRGAYGISAAARTYFDKTVQELDIKDCAYLIAILKAPSRYSVNHELARTVRDRALYAFYKTDNIARAEYDSLQAADLGLITPKRNVGRAPYFTEMVRQYIQKKYGDDALYSSGLRVFTTLDWSMQDAAETALNRRIDSLRARVARTVSIEDKQFRIQVPDTLDEFGRPVFELKKIQGALVAIDNETGSIVSMVGGRDFQESKFNRAIQAQRQPGSSFKPFVYTAAIDNGFRPMDIVYDNPIVLDIPGAKQWRPANFDNKFMGPLTVRDGIRLSRNLVSISLLLKVTAPQVIFYAKRFGITSPIPNVPSIGIGSNEVTVIDLTSAFTVFPNHGIRIKPHYISKIVDRYGNVLEEVLSPAKEEVLSEESAYIMVDMLKTVVDYGTGRGVRSHGFYRPTGGKTGTTNAYTDNWFVGFTPQITCGVWIGFDDKTTLGNKQYGSTNALPVWTEFMKRAHDSLPIEDFEIPENILFANVCLESQALATNLCEDVRYEVFTSHSIPIDICPKHPSPKLYPGIAKYDYYKKVSDPDDEDRVTF
ncbi:MAG: transglycosylase domain-containing protein, partial [candidate division Zixibacteria bacterium]|nr:transglycosylase domain-containing protein [candidate division Zixibacteria bacterium]